MKNKKPINLIAPKNAGSIIRKTIKKQMEKLKE